MKFYRKTIKELGVENSVPSYDIYDFRKNLSDLVKEIGYGVTALECNDFPFMGYEGLGVFLFIDGQLQRIVFELPVVLDQSDETKYPGKTFKKIKEKIINEKNLTKKLIIPLKIKIARMREFTRKTIQEAEMPESFRSFFLIFYKLKEKYGEGPQSQNSKIKDYNVLEVKYAENTVILREFPISFSKSKLHKTGFKLIYTSKDYGELLLQKQSKQLEAEL